MIVGIDTDLLIMLLGFSIGLLWGEAFSGMDYQLKYIVLKESTEPFWVFFRWLFGAILDTQHHFQYGIVLILVVAYVDELLVYMPQLAILKIGVVGTIVTYMGLGLVVSDLKDYQYVLKRFGLITELTQK